MPEKLQGTALSSKDFTHKNIITYQDALQSTYNWDTGVGIGHYLQGLKEGRILGRECRQCRRILIPPRMFCELCFRPTHSFVQVKDTGRVNTFSICYVHWDASRLQPGEKPYLPAVIELDGASKGMGLLHLLGEVEPEHIRIGMKVVAVWKKEEDREGAITDIQYFKPENEGVSDHAGADHQ